MYDQDTNLIFTKKKNTIGRFARGGNRESMTVLVSAAVLVEKFLPLIRDSSYSGDSSSHIEKMWSTSRASTRERKSNQRKKRKNKWKRIRQGGPKYFEIFIQNFSVLLRNKSVFMFYSIFSRGTGKSTNFRAKTHIGVPAIFFGTYFKGYTLTYFKGSQ